MEIEDPLIECPYNQSHAILKSRMQAHLVKCKQNYLMAGKKICPFNAVHHVDKLDYQYHVSTCPDRRIIEGYKYEVEESEHGDLELAPYHEPELTQTEEDWDAEAPVSAYDPTQHVEAAPVVRLLQGASKSQRKAFRLRERQRMQRLMEGDTDDGPSTSVDSLPGPLITEDGMTPLRLPHETSEALRLLDSSMGLGRGRSSHIMEENCNLGFGRGGPIKNILSIPIGIGRGRPLVN